MVGAHRLAEERMGDFAADTSLRGADGRYTATLSRDWELWGPSGGYMASICLRAAGQASRFKRPASFAAHYLGLAEFGEANVLVTALRTAKRAESLRVTLSQAGRPIIEAMVWTLDDMDGLAHDEHVAPDVPGPDALKSFEDLWSEDEKQAGFWNNLEGKPSQYITPWPPDRALPAVVRDWYRFRPASTFEDPFVDAARSLLLIDTMPWRAAMRAHGYKRAGWVAPTIDVNVNFHRLIPETEWLLCAAEAPIAHAGVIAGRVGIWSEDRRLIASGTSNLLCRRVPVGTPGAV